MERNNSYSCLFLSQRPYHIEYTSSRLITEVKQCWALLVLGWVTAWEHRVLLASSLFLLWCNKPTVFYNAKINQTALSEWKEDNSYSCLFLSQRPYHIEYTSSRLITEVKQCWALLVLGWVTAWEHRVLLASSLFLLWCNKPTVFYDATTE